MSTSEDLFEELNLKKDEKILLRQNNVYYGNSSSSSNILVLTNQALIWVNNSFFKSKRGTYRFPLSCINQVLVRNNSDEFKQIEIYHTNGHNCFNFGEDGENRLKVWELAIEDRFAIYSDKYSASYYEDLIHYADKELEEENRKEDDFDPLGAAAGFIGGAAKGALMTKSIPAGIGMSVLSSVAPAALDAIGLGDNKSQNQNKPKQITFYDKIVQARAERTKLMQEKEIDEAKKLEDQKLSDDKQATDEIVEDSKTSSLHPVSIQEQAASLKAFKELLDMGVLTEEEFEVKKQEILNI